MGAPGTTFKRNKWTVGKTAKRTNSPMGKTDQMNHREGSESRNPKHRFKVMQGRWVCMNSSAYITGEEPSNNGSAVTLRSKEHKTA
jgi:hypothetical protein